MKHYLAMWDCNGLECLFDVDKHMKEYDDWEKQKIVAILKESKTQPLRPVSIPLQAMILRAKINSQRAYEIYEFNSTMDYPELKETFEDNPQPVVEWIRINGVKIYSDYIKSDRKIIV